MSKKTTQSVNEKLKAAFADVQPANPTLNSADKSYLRSLMRRGFTEAEIRTVATKAGLNVPQDFFVVKKKVVVQK